MSDAVIIPFPADEQRPASVNNLVRNRRFDKARTCLYGLWLNGWLPGGTYDYLRRRVNRVHNRWTGWRVAAREGLVIVAQVQTNLDHHEYVEIAEGFEEDFEHLPPWFTTLDVLADEAAALTRLDDGDPSAVHRAEADDVRAHLDECLTRLLSPAGATS